MGKTILEKLMKKINAKFGPQKITSTFDKNIFLDQFRKKWFVQFFMR